MIAVLSLLLIPSQARADQAVAAAHSLSRQKAADGPPSGRGSRAQASMMDAYGAREAGAKGLATFNGGHRVVVIAGSTVVIVLLVVLIVILV